jgi:DNA-binding transcriptional LysR family regulator
MPIFYRDGTRSTAHAGFSTVRAISFKELAGKRLLLPSTRRGLRTIVERCAADAEITLDVVGEADSYATLKDPVRHGHGWTILPLAPDLSGCHR